MKHIIRVILEYNVEKIYKQYNQIKYLLPPHKIYFYDIINTKIEKIIKYNIFLDTIPEKTLKLCPSKYNILLVNDKYVNNLYLRRESYIDTPLILLNDVVDYYCCLTLYSKNILLTKHNISNNKLFYLKNSITNNFYKNTLKYENNKKYILYDIDFYSKQDNLLFLQTWIKYYIHRDEILIIIYKVLYDYIFKYFNDLMYNDKLYKNSYALRSYSNKIHNIYKNIILTSDSSIITNKYIYASVINTSYYNLTSMINENILKLRYIITVNNDIINQEYIDKNINLLIIEKYNESNICICLDKLFSNKNNKINDIVNNNKKILLENIEETKNQIFKFFKLDDKHKYEYEEIKINNSDELILQNDYDKLLINLHNNIKDKINKIDIKFNKSFNTYDTNDIFNKYYRILKKPSDDAKTKYAFATIIILTPSYISSILATGYIMKYINKTKYNLICFVQDKPYYENGILKFVGLSEEDINNIGLYYDCIVGIDLLHTKISKKRHLNLGFHKYTNISYYVTKYVICSFILYDKIFYYDASTIIKNNIDYYFIKYNENKFYNTNNKNYNRGLVGNLFMIIPKIYYINKLIYINNNYSKYFENNLFFTPDEDIFYYTIYPNWSSKQIKYDDIKSNAFRNPYINLYNKNYLKYIFESYVIFKPFKYIKTNESNALFNINHTCYKIWDETIKKIIIKYPKLYKYVEYIKTFRETLF
jgi:hypothetical protein